MKAPLDNRVLERMNGRVLNTAALGRLAGIGRTAAAARVRDAARRGRLRLLPFYGGGHKPVLYTLPARGFRGVCVDAVISRIRASDPECRFYWWRTGRVRVLDLVAVVRGLRIGFRFTPRWILRQGDFLPFRIAHRRNLIDRGFLLHQGTDRVLTARMVRALPVVEFLRDPEAWIRRCRRPLPADRLRAWALPPRVRRAVS